MLEFDVGKEILANIIIILIIVRLVKIISNRKHKPEKRSENKLQGPLTSLKDQIAEA